MNTNVDNKIKNIQVIDKHEEKVWSCQFHSIEDLLATSGSDKKIIIHSNSSGLYATRAILDDSHSRTIRCVCWDYSGNYLASASFDSTINIWKKKRTGDHLEFECISSLEGHENEVKSVSWSLSGQYLASCSRDKTIWIWDIDEDMDFSCNNVLQGHTQDVKMVKWSPKEDILFSCGYDDVIKVWQYEESQEDWTCINTLKNHTSTVWTIDITKLGDYLVTGSEDKSIILWKIDTGNYKNINMLYKVNDCHSRAVLSLSFNYDDSFLLAGSSDNTISLWKVDVKNNVLNLIEKVEDAHNEDVNCVSWNNSQLGNKNIFASCSDDGLVKIWSTNLI
jgi:WD40 repeat protein